MSEGYPVMLRLVGRSCVIVGGGAVGTRKTAGLLSTGAQITIISPTLDPELEKLAEDGTIIVYRQSYTYGMLHKLQPFLVFAATNDFEANRLVVNEAQVLGTLVNCTDSSAQSDFMGMSIIRRGPITVALSTGGASPALAGHLRRRLEEVIGEEYTVLATWLAEARYVVRDSTTTQPERVVVWHRILESPILDELRRGNEAAARNLFNRLILEAAGN